MIDYPVPSRVRVVPDNGTSFEAPIMGLVANGVWLQGAHALTFRAPVTLRFLLGGGLELALRAEVVSSVATGVGFEVRADSPPEAFGVLAAWAAGRNAKLSEPIAERLERLGAGLHARVKTPFRPLAGVRVLVVEDEPAVAHLLELALSKRGAAVLVARDGAEALALPAERFDAVLLDWMLPKVPGDEVLRALRERAPKLPVAIVSGVIRVGDTRDAALELGAETVFSKPFKLALICEWVERVTGAVP